MPQPPVGQRPAPPRVPDPTVQRAVEELHRRLKDMEDRSRSTELSSSLANLSGSAVSAFASLSGTVNSAVVAANAGVTALSGTVNAQLLFDGLQPPLGCRYFNDFCDTYKDGSNTSGGTVGVKSSEPGHPGILRHTCNAASGSIVDSFLQVSLFGGGSIRYRTMSRIISLSNGTDNFGWRVGFQDVGGAPSSHGVYFEYDLTRNGTSNWKFVTAATGSRAVTDMGIAPVANSWYLFEIDVAPAGDAVTGSITSGSTSATVATKTYIPGPSDVSADQEHVNCLNKTLGSGVGSSMDADFLELVYLFSVPRF